VGVRSLVSVPSLRARLAALRTAPIGPRTYRVITATALVALVAIVVSGAAVRLTGSGLGCPTWPSCEDGSLVPRGATGVHGWVEFVNRTFTGAVSVAVALAVLGSRRLPSRRRDLTLLSWGLVAGVFAQALLGGLVVLVEVAPLAVAGHYLLSAVLVANAVVLHHRAALPEHGRRPAATPSVLRLSKVLVAAGAAVLVTGTLVTGSGPHGGDEAADRLPFAVRSVVPFHSAAAWALLVVAMVLLYRADRGDVAPEVLGRGRLLIAAIGLQGTIGYVQYYTDVPEGLVGIHVLGSALVWVAVLRLHLALHEGVPGPLEDAPASGAVAVVG
jgi:cytochrome c oxidase assembly protein subunit 15